MGKSHWKEHGRTEATVTQQMDQRDEILEKLIQHQNRQMEQKHQEMLYQSNRISPSQLYSNLSHTQKIIQTTFKQYSLVPLNGWIQYGSKEELLNLLERSLPLYTSKESDAVDASTSALPTFEYCEIDNTIRSNKKLNSLCGVRVILNSLLRELFRGKTLYMETKDRKTFNEATKAPLCRNYSINLEEYKYPSFQNRKPDFVANFANYVGPQAIVLIGNFTSRANFSFTKEEKGKLIDFARALLFHEQFHRHFIFCFLSDGIRFQFFRVEKLVENDLDDLRVRIFPVVIGIQGWQVSHSVDFRFSIIPCIDLIFPVEYATAIFGLPRLLH